MSEIKEPRTFVDHGSKERPGTRCWLGSLGGPYRLYVTRRVQGTQVDLLYDTGASCDVISHRLWSQLPEGSRPELEESQIQLASLGGQNLLMWSKCPVTLEVEGQCVTCMVQVCEVGFDALRILRTQWDWDEDRLVLGCADPLRRMETGPRKLRIHKETRPQG